MTVKNQIIQIIKEALKKRDMSTETFAKEIGMPYNMAKDMLDNKRAYFLLSSDRDILSTIEETLEIKFEVSYIDKKSK